MIPIKIDSGDLPDAVLLHASPVVLSLKLANSSPPEAAALRRFFVLLLVLLPLAMAVLLLLLEDEERFTLLSDPLLSRTIRPRVDILFNLQAPQV